MYFELVQATRALLVPRGWEPIDEGLSLTIRPELSIALAVSSGNDHTGDRTRNPAFKYSKGPTTQAAITGNATQMDMFDIVPGFAEPVSPSTKKPIDSESFKTWWLLHYVNPAKEIMRAELSLPVEIDETYQWEHRIILDPISFDDEPDADRADGGPDGPDFDVEVRKKA